MLAGAPVVGLVSDKGTPVPYKLTDNGDRTYRAEFTATIAGVVTANVFFASKPVPRSPFRIDVQPGGAVDTSKITVRGLPESECSARISAGFGGALTSFLQTTILRWGVEF